MGTEVYHVKEPTFWDKDVFEFPVAYVHVATVKTDCKEVAYQLTNSIDNFWWENEGVTSHFDGTGCRSTSVGDVVICPDGVTYRCAGIGWKVVTQTSNPVCGNMVVDINSGD